MALTDAQLYAFEVTERLGSVLSLLGTAYIIGTFLFSKEFHKPINRLVFYASWGNIITNIGTLISTSGMDPGVRSPLCQSQAFLINTFMPADALWTLAMAMNVYLTLFRKYNAQQLRALEWKYMLFCYGIPIIPSFVFLFVENSEGEKVFGSATLWCWISPKWAYLRVAAFYGPVWIVIAITFVIYIWAGREIFAKRRQLRNFSSAANDAPFPVIQNPFLSPFVSVKTTEIQVTRELARLPANNGSTQSFTLNDSGRIVSTQGFDPYSVNVGTGPTCDSTLAPPASRHQTSSSMGLGADKISQQHRIAMEANKAAFSYCKCALLFFASLLITWVPSSLNRLYSLAQPRSVNFPLLFIASLVLPLQGFWNAVIYIATSLPASKALMKQIGHKLMPARKATSPTPYPPGSLPKISDASSEDSLKAFAPRIEKHHA